MLIKNTHAIITRLRGVVILINTLMPLLLVLSIIACYLYIKAPVTQISQSMYNIGATVVDIKSDADKLSTSIDKKINDSNRRLKNATIVLTVVDKTISKGFAKLNIKTNFPELPKIVGIKLPQIPNINVPIGDVISIPFKKIAEFMGYFAKIGKNFSDISRMIAVFMDSDNIHKIEYELDLVEKSSADLLTKIAKIFTILVVVITLVIPWIILSYILWAYNRFVISINLILNNKTT